MPLIGTETESSEYEMWADLAIPEIIQVAVSSGGWIWDDCV